MFKGRSLLFIVFLIFTLAVHAQGTEEHDGYMGDDVADDYYEVNLDAGQTVIATGEATSGNLDPYLFLLDASETTIAENDDIVPFQNLDSQIVYTASTSGTYYVVMSNIRDTGGDYHLTIEIAEAGSGYEAQAQSAPPADLSNAARQNFEGYIHTADEEIAYPVQIADGQGVIITADALDQSLDTIVGVADMAGNVLAYNDDREFGNTNSRVTFIPEVGGSYEVLVSSYGTTTGSYALEIAIADAYTVDQLSREQLSGPRQDYETEHFIIHYTLEGEDATTPEFVARVVESIEEVYQREIVEIGWALPPTDGKRGGDSRYDVYIKDLLTGGEGGELGFASPEFPSEDNPHTPLIEAEAVPGYLVIDRSYNVGGESASEIDRVLRATLAHEFHHVIQFGYDHLEPMGWYYEATSAYMETITLPEEDATGYVAGVYEYPEICFGVEGDADPTGGLLMYGTWVFMEAMADQFGADIVRELWENISQADDWKPLETTLVNHGVSLADMVAYYHVKNLVRDYDLADRFGATVWLENTINADGTWTFTGQGIQELAANYFRFDLKGTYNVAVNGDSDVILLAVGIRGGEADAFSIGASGTVDTSAYSDFYLIAFNTRYDDDTSACEYASYSIDVRVGNGTPAPVFFSVNANQYQRLEPR